MTVRLQTLKSIYGGDLSGRTLVMPTFGHSRKDRGTSVTDKPGAPGDLLVFVHNGSPKDALSAKDEFLRALGEEPIARGRPSYDPLAAMTRRIKLREAAERAELDADRRRHRARAIWQAAKDPRGTLVETYLRSRALDLPDELAGAALRFHTACPWESGIVPAMLAVMREIGTGDVVAIHRTALTTEGKKIGRKMLGVVAGAAVMLDATIADALTIGEGIETAMAARQLGIRPTWALGSVGAIAAFPLIEGVETLTILGERDANGANARACHEVGDRWDTAGRTVDVVTPRIGNDMNDTLMGDASWA